MKNQYFGDINDYRKYGLLRLLAGVGGLRIGVAWMLTPDDGRSDGGKITYVSHPEQWRESDPTLFNFLARAVTKESSRNLTTFENAGLVPKAVYHSEQLGDSLADRAAYMESMLTKFEGLDLVFFDPDNGLEVNSRPMGRKGASKFLGMAEVTKVFKTGMSMLIFQHFGRVKRDVGEWGRKDATLSDTTACEDFGLTRVEILAAIREGHLHCREGSAHGNPFLRLLRREVEALVEAKNGAVYLKTQLVQAEVQKISKELKTLKPWPGSGQQEGEGRRAPPQKHHQKR